MFIAIVHAPFQQNASPAYSLASLVDIGGLECPNCEQPNAIKCIPDDE